MKKRVLAFALASSMALVACGGVATAPTTTETTAADAAGATQETTTVAGNEGGNEAGDVATIDWSAYDALVKNIYAETDLVKREAMMHEAEDMLMDTGAVIPIYHYNDLYLLNPSIEGIYTNPFGTKFFMYATKDGQAFDKFRIQIGSEPAYLDPHLNSSNDGGILASNTFAGLYTTDKDAKVVPDLADGDPVISEDGLEYTIKLKTGLKWSDGSTLNANDFVYSWQRAADPETAADYSYLYSMFAKNDEGKIDVSAPDENTLTFKLIAPTTYMMNLLTFPVYMPVPQAGVEANADYKTNPGGWAMEAGFVSNGAYTLKEWKHNESMVYVKNPNYHDADNVTVDELHFMLSADDTVILAAYQAGNLEFADTVPNGEIPNLKNLPDFKVVDNLGTYYAIFNVKSKLFEGKTVEEAAAMRKAFWYLIDRDYIIETIAQTGQKLATTFVPPQMSDGHGGEFKVNDSDYTYPIKEAIGYYEKERDVEMAVELLREAGFEFDGDKLSASTPIKFTYLTNQGTGHEAIAQAMQQDFAEVGIEMEIATMDWQTFLQDRKAGNFDMARNGWIADYDDPVNFLEIFLSESGNNDAQLGK